MGKDEDAGAGWGDGADGDGGVADDKSRDCSSLRMIVVRAETMTATSVASRSMEILMGKSLTRFSGLENVCSKN
jgi:hypothetical protein